MIDGELIIVTDRHLNFDALSSGCAPQESRWQQHCRSRRTVPDPIRRLRRARHRRRLLLSASFAERPRSSGTAPRLPDSMHHPATTDGASLTLVPYLRGAGLDGLVAKPLTGTYRPGEAGPAEGQHRRTTDAVVPAWHHQAGSPTGGTWSVPLGLYDDDGRLHPGGIRPASPPPTPRTAVGTSQEHRALPAVGATSRGACGAGGPSRWRKRGNEGETCTWCQAGSRGRLRRHGGDRFRHVTPLRVGWRPGPATGVVRVRPTGAIRRRSTSTSLLR